MPIYLFKSENPASPYYERPKEVLMGHKEYEARKDSFKCEVTGSPLKRTYQKQGGSFRFNLKPDMG